jgi:V/A-type H+-transporting ATPase subunit C
LPFDKIETALYSYLYSSIYEVIKNDSIGETQKNLYEIFNSYIDLYNFVRIVRLKRYYNKKKDEILPFLLPFGTLKQKQIFSMLDAKTPEESIEIMKKTQAGKKIGAIEYQWIDELPSRINYLKCSKFIRFSIAPPVVMFSYIALIEIEISDIITIIEGIRYNVPGEEIFKILVGVK